jgi:release factor glutamine methyltransferase
LPAVRDNEYGGQARRYVEDPAVATEGPLTVGELLKKSGDFLRDKGVESWSLDAQILLAHALSCKRIEVFTRFESEPTEAQRTAFRELIRQRVAGCPVAYLVGRKEFFSLELEVNRDVLIPRPDSEAVVVEFLAEAKEHPAPRVLDLGTGSGNLAIAIARQCKNARVTTVDRSEAALAVARRNAEKHAVSERVTFLCGDLFAPLPEGAKFDFLVSNPPYIPTEEIPKLDVGVRNYEPHLALDGGADGFVVFDRILTGAPAVLEPGAWLLIEIGSPQETEAKLRVEDPGYYELDRVVRDSSGHPRVLRARYRG